MTHAITEEKSDDLQRTPGLRNGRGHGTWQGYVIGYVSAAVLTVAAFAVAQSHILVPSSIAAATCVLAVAQMFVHLIFFLHINTAPEQRSNILAFSATLLIITIVVVGSLWIMDHLNTNMMPVEKMLKMQR